MDLEEVGAMPSQKLTKRAADAATPGRKTFVIYDTDLRGFGLRVTPSGFKSWIVEYRPAGTGRAGNKKRLTLGPTTVVTSEKARQRAKDTLALIRGGHDSLAERAGERAAPTVAHIMTRFLAEHAEVRRKASTTGLYRLATNRYIIPAIGSQKAATITAADVIRLHSSLTGKPTLAEPCLRHIE